MFAITVQLIKTWSELKECLSETHTLRIDLKMESGWIVDKKSNETKYYLSSHSFYDSSYKGSTKLLQECGFNVQLENLDK